MDLNGKSGPLRKSATLIRADRGIVSGCGDFHFCDPVSADASAVDAFRKSFNGTMTAESEGLNLFFTVPDGKQLVIE